MKIISLILALFFIGLSLAPCSDTLQESSDVEIVFDDSTNESHDTEPDLCSPFCVCHCCHTHLVLVYIIHDDVNPKPEENVNLGSVHNTAKGYLNPVLHPPIV